MYSGDQIAQLRAEIVSDPLGRGYVGMTDQQLTDSLNTVNRTLNRELLSGDEVFASTDAGEYAALPDGAGNNPDTKGHWLAFCARAEINPFSAANVAFVTNLFGAGSGTVLALNVLRTMPGSRLAELELPPATVGDVMQARA